MKHFFKSWKKILAFVFSWLLIVGLFQIAGYLAAGVDIRHTTGDQLTLWQTFVVSVFNMAGTILVIWLFLRYSDHAPFTTIGFHPAKGKQVAVWFAAGFIIMLSGFGISLLCHQINFLSAHLNLPYLLLSIGIYAAVAITEEALMRGYVLNKLLKHYNQWVALFWSAILFACLHLFNPNIGILPMINLVLAGVLLGLPYLFTKNLWYSVALHFSWNFFQAMFGFSVSGMSFYAIITQGKTANTIWNGGLFGFEGSAICIALQIITIAIACLVHRRSKQAVAIYL